MKIKNKYNKKINPPKLKLRVHSNLTRLMLLISAAFIFSFNTFARVDVGAQDTKSAITTQNLIDSHNKIRKENSIGELTYNYLLSKSAQAKADAMINSNCWSHYCPDGESPWVFFEKSNYNYVFAGENLGEGFYNIENLMNAWIKSPSHRENILKKEYTEVGFGIAYGNFQGNKNNILVTAHFGARDNNVSLSSDNQKIEITNPKSGESFSENIVNIKGNTQGLEKINIILNNVDQGSAKIDKGIFTFDLKNLVTGKNELFAQGNKDKASLNSNNVEVYLNLNAKPISSESNLNNLNFNISSINKNLINLIFALLLGGFFLVDMLIIKRSIMIKSNRSFSHYHLVIFLTLAIIILIGGFGGNIKNGLHF